MRIISHWEYIDEIESIRPSRCLSVGFLIEEKEQYKTIAQSISDTQVSGRTTILRCSIQRIREIKT